jgi:hypothetical protein
MDATSLMLSMVFGTVGLGYLMFAKKAGRFVPAIAGVALMVVPYLISSNLVMVIVCLGLASVPFVLRDL